MFAAAQQAHLALTEEPVWEYDWDLDKADYIRLLREYDRHRNPSDLAAFVPVVRLGE